MADLDRAGARPYPCRYVITSKKVTGWPQYTIDIWAWKTGGEVTSDDFKLEIPTGAKQLTPGEVAELKDNINTMISNLRETTESNRAQDWLKTNLAKFSGMLQGQRELNTVGRMLLTEHHVAALPVQRPPLRNAALQGTTHPR